jgi:hypothetical protein
MLPSDKPLQLGFPCTAAFAVGFSFIVIGTVAGEAQATDGVKVYEFVPGVDVLIVAGLHVPVTPLVDVVGSASGVSPAQYGPIGSKVVTGLGLTVTVIVVPLAHCPAFAVKVYTVFPEVDVLMVDGDHVPVIPF